MRGMRCQVVQTNGLATTDWALMQPMEAEVVVAANGVTVWVNSPVDGSCIGRFSKTFGVDVHNCGSDQVAGKGECLFCTHGPAGQQEWDRFRREMKQHHNVDIKAELLSW